MVYDFHTHSFLSDGVLSPVEVLRHAVVYGYRAIAITDHVGPGNCAQVLAQVIEECEFCARHWNIIAIPGVELTHVPSPGIAEVARFAREHGAKIVVVHGETIVEPVEPGTNLAAVTCGDVDILAHPGLLTAEVAATAATNGVFIEISGRKGHCYTNGHVARVGREAGVRFLVDSDSHEPKDFLTPSFAAKVAQGAGLDAAEVARTLEENPRHLLAKLGYQTA
ncbi:MAG: histidinol phosphate phosphatase domain-containing protein [Chloroflexi bacterium]|nr:histidinol phosphate phosphatase domain-containing protein [Chloroflexota bacterium]